MLLAGGRGGRNRIGATVALAAVLVMVLAAPAGASGWGWGEDRSWSGGFFEHVLVWLGLAPSPGGNTRTDAVLSHKPGSSPKLSNGAMALTKSDATDRSASIDPNGHS
jgi:hypothetical protein